MQNYQFLSYVQIFLLLMLLLFLISAGGRMMGHFGVKKTLEILHEHFYWPSMKHDVQSVCDKCIPYKQAKSKVMPMVSIHLCLCLITLGPMFQWILC